MKRRNLLTALIAAPFAALGVKLAKAEDEPLVHHFAGVDVRLWRVEGADWVECQSPSAVNDSARRMMASLATVYDVHPGTGEMVPEGMPFADGTTPRDLYYNGGPYEHVRLGTAPA